MEQMGQEKISENHSSHQSSRWDQVRLTRLIRREKKCSQPKDRRGLRLAVFSWGTLFLALVPAYLLIASFFLLELDESKGLRLMVVSIICLSLLVVSSIINSVRAFIFCLKHLSATCTTSAESGKGRAFAGLIISFPIFLGAAIILVIYLVNI
jgi:hypothetical protein